MRHNSNRFSATISTIMLLVIFTFLTTITTQAAEVDWVRVWGT